MNYLILLGGAGAAPRRRGARRVSETGRSRRRFAVLTLRTIPWASYFSVAGGFSRHYFVQGSRRWNHGDTSRVKAL